MVKIRCEFQWLKWLKLYMIFKGRGLSNGWTYIIYKKIVLENSYDLCREYIWLYRGFMKEYKEKYCR